MCTLLIIQLYIVKTLKLPRASRRNILATRIATIAHGSIGAFESSEEDWELYVERVELYLAANKITDKGQRRDVLLSVCGAKTYHILRDLLAPKKPSATDYEDVVKCLKTLQPEARSGGPPLRGTCSSN